ncbi:MAG: hypothetical protein JO129_02985 [Candidatus Dependentiae bacterium]|nr:hypothetical protein [Candidatus Dependentiae bacterium]
MKNKFLTLILLAGCAVVQGSAFEKIVTNQDSNINFPAPRNRTVSFEANRRSPLFINTTPTSLPSLSSGANTPFHSIETEQAPAVQDFKRALDDHSYNTAFHIVFDNLKDIDAQLVQDFRNSLDRMSPEEKAKKYNYTIIKNIKTLLACASTESSEELHQILKKTYNQRSESVNQRFSVSNLACLRNAAKLAENSANRSEVYKELKELYLSI